MIKKNSNKVKRIFNKISSKYDFLNNLLSFGFHNLWKKKLIKLLNPKDGEIWADLCCGSGDLAFLINKKVFPRGNVIGIDNANEILNVARLKSEKVKRNVITWIKGDILKLNEFQKFDGICMSYGLRNLESVDNGIQKVFLLLKSNGRAGFLDFNHSPRNSISSIFQKIYLRIIVVPISSCFNLRDEYKYIENSIKGFPEGDKLISISKKIGFKEVSYKTIFGGQMGILILKK
ncbi:MAG: bifunctional demethylmenaquinone methyltransferase/2-methoxy-6-polyprenyl-1,4-benzoquinol methylase UbiE [Prochlorococcus sp. SP3034]|nr:bifunctional demethylmenaquinone methyltransferase/2-methoxy-6-polyprenyl-1,4-benzoquinol methylase UbiE [Prochlorococcus sp. SP3034]|tara:strand:- start:1892 stop:2590 length:699 start_codon:yes stop_codon:yes gene_type:complete